VRTLRTSLTDSLSIVVPVVQAPIGAATCPALAAAVSNAGGLGMLSVTWRSYEDIRHVLRETRLLTDAPFGVNLVLDFPIEERLDLCLSEGGVRIVSFSWGDPAVYIEQVHQAGGVVMQTVGSAAEARRAVEVGADVLVAQGFEGGGHILGDVCLLPLVPSVVDVAGTVPVVAAGGIADGRGLTAALALGAAGAWMGTRFLASEEAFAHEIYKQKVVEACETDTVYSTLFDGGWPGAPHRVLRNSTVAAWETAGRPASTARQGSGEVIGVRSDGGKVQRFDDAIPLPDSKGDVEAFSLYAGQGAGLIREIKPAAVIVREIVEEARSAIASLAGFAS
jgi:nitronate monooxygenase